MTLPPLSRSRWIAVLVIGCACVILLFIGSEAVRAPFLELVARIIEPTLLLRVEACGDLNLAANDSLPFYADVIHKTASGGFSGGGEFVYSSRGNPHTVHWTVGYPRYLPRGKAEITEHGVLIARDTGYVFAVASSAGKTERREVHIVPRVIRFTVRPTDTTVNVGDSLVAHAEVEIEGQPGRQYLKWILPESGRRQKRLLDLVEQDPDDKAIWEHRDLRLVAIAPGIARVRACATAARQDTMTVRVIGEALPLDENGLAVRGSRSDPPALRLNPIDTTLLAGETFRVNLRILNANLANGPWRWRVAYGDGEVSEGTRDVLATSPFGFLLDIEEHVYRSEGKFAVAATVTDSAGRSTTVRTSITAIALQADIEVLPGVTPKVVRLSDPRPDIPIAIRSTSGLQAPPSEILWLDPSRATRAAGVPMLRFGHTEYVWNPDAGFGAEQRDINGDGEPDLILHVDKAALRRNGDLHLGHNRLTVTGAVMRPSVAGAPRLFTPFRGVAVFDVIP